MVKKTLTDKRFLGFFEFYNNQFGFIGTNTINNEQDEENVEFIGIYVSYYEIDGSFSHEEGDWVTFSIYENNKGKKAKRLKSAYTTEGLTIALLQYWQHPHIQGWNPKKTDYYSKHAIFDPLNVFLKKSPDNKSKFIEILCDCTNKVNNSELFLDTILSDNQIFPLLSDCIFDVIITHKNFDSFEIIKNKFFNIFFNKYIDFNKILILFNNNIDLDKYLNVILENLITKYNEEINKFINEISYENIKKIFTAYQNQYISWSLAKCLYDKFESSLLNIFPYNENLSENILFFLFLSGRNESLLYITEWSNLLDNLTEDYVSKLSQYLLSESHHYHTDLLAHFSSANLVKILNSLSDTSLYAALNFLCDKNERLLLASSLKLRDNNVIKDFKEQKWLHIRSQINYMVIDLESDQNHIWDFAFLHDNNSQRYESEDKLIILKQVIDKSKIIVGHNIKDWDLPILEQKGIPIEGFVWDTLEMELLLNPSRYAYSLLTLHKALDDVKLTDNLFWNQLYRLAQNPDLRTELRSFLPENLEAVLSKLSISPYREFFEENIASMTTFFKDRIPLSHETKNELLKLLEESAKGKILLIAPKTLWAELSVYLPLRFPTLINASEYRMISKDFVETFPLDNPFSQAFLLRFCEAQVTPIVANIPLYLRKLENSAHKQTLDPSTLNRFTVNCNGSIDCVDFDILEDGSALADDYIKIVIINEGLNIFHKIKLGSDMTYSEVMNLGRTLLLGMSSSDCVSISKNEFYELFESSNDKLKGAFDNYTANIWLERTASGNYSLYKNYFIEDKLKCFLELYHDNYTNLKWSLELPESSAILNIATCVKGHFFDGSEFRVNSSSPYRGKYWTAQIAFLNEIHKLHPNLPIIYVIDQLGVDELKALQKFLESQGFVIPKEFQSLNGLEIAFRKKHAVLLINKETFIHEIRCYKTDKAFIVVWDNLEIERLQVMWKELPCKIEPSQDHEETQARVRHTTIAECLEIVLKLIQHYCNIVMVNNVDSRFYVLESAFDDCPNLEKQLGSNQIQYLRLPLWNSLEEWNSSYDQAQIYFAGWSQEVKNDLGVEVSKKLISKMFIGGQAWRGEQENVLNFMLAKQGDCLVSIPTGGGKSVLFQGPAILKGKLSKKLTLVITPLRALMVDQVNDLQEKGFGEVTDFISSDLSYAEIKQVYRRIISGDIICLYITPERFRVKSFMHVLTQRMELDNGLEYVIFDEAHCIAQWGNDFRPDYYNALKFCVELKKQYHFTIALFSATITSQEEIEYKRLLPDLEWLGQKREDYNPVRQHIEVNFKLVEHNDKARLAAIIKFIKQCDIDVSTSRILIFCRTQRACENYSELLNQDCDNSTEDELKKFAGHISYYHAGMEDFDRNDTYKRFKSDKSKPNKQIYILFSTKAFGMGMDIPNIHYLMHANPPAILEDYLQEVGRAGRDQKLYERVFPLPQGGGNRSLIPAECLISQKDFAQLKDLLLNSLLAWSNLSEVKAEICDYIRKFRDLNDIASCSQSVVVPWNIWSKNPNDFTDTVATKLIFHWLEKAERIRLGYIMPAYFDITLSEINPPSNLSKNLCELLHTLFELSNKQYKRTQFLIKDVLQRSASFHTLSEILDAVLVLEDLNLLEFNQVMIYKLTERRYCETKYAFEKNTYSLLSLIYYFNEAIEFIKTLEPEVKYEIDEDMCKEFVNNVLNNIINQYEDIIINNEHMPWYNDVQNTSKKCITKYDTFKNDIINFGIHRMFLIFSHTPGIIFKDNKKERSIRVINNTWKVFLNNLKSDCIKLLKIIYDNNDYNIWLRWSTFARSNGLIKYGYSYFETILTILRKFGYIFHSSILPTGIEVYPTEKFNEPIDEGKDSNSFLYQLRREFDEQEFLKKIRLACMNVFSKVKEKNDTNIFIQQYFQCSDISSYLTLIENFVKKTDLNDIEQEEILKELNEVALKEEESNLNADQLRIYEQSVQQHVNVFAGPGSGKTHVLILRCAKLIYQEKVEPSQVLVLAYNRAVVVELRNRLNKLFSDLGLSRFAKRISVFTFHAFAKRCLGEQIDNIDTEKWDECLHTFLLEHRNEFKAIFPQIKHVLVDEFQDINQNRLNYLIEIHNIYPEAKFFTIGDINQSIYGFDRVSHVAHINNLSPQEYANIIDPQYYYDKWKDLLHPVEMTMCINYRSYPEILKYSAKYLPPNSEIPKASEALKKEAFKHKYCHEEQVKKIIFDDQQWKNTIHDCLIWSQELNNKNDNKHKIKTIAVLFRTNVEVYRAWSILRPIIDSKVRMRIQGQSINKIWKKRECYEIIQCFERIKDVEIDLTENCSADDQDNLKTYGDIKRLISDKRNYYSDQWDVFYLDVLESIIHNFVEEFIDDDKILTFKDLIDYIIDILSNDDGHIYKIYEEYYNNDNSLEIILTTMHKVKGLEFDIVFTIASNCKLPYERKFNTGSRLNQADFADIYEEKRLMFVSCTRAKKFLYVYQGPREKSLIDEKIYYCYNDKNYIYEKEPGLDNYYLDYNAQDNFEANETILSLKINSPVYIKKDDNRYNIYTNEDICIGSLANKSSIAKYMNATIKSKLDGFFVSDVIARRYIDCVKNDEKNGKDWHKRWSQAAIDKGYVYIVVISGVAEINNDNSQIIY